ncbi:hypothetical protein [Mycobacteroides salmoniphilum]|uniref:Uncharacterized protein n=1 Tax=Mycobacteroides salmoniphilum TaxID=404941 RepID=A0A4V3HZD4_9MYCO|nr:hypothetical protein [Mycobacteroides salmoniphilum]TDZ93524.1 hypothetical protein CCUG60885_03127 [Mycobacteroides salmoniphilum]TEA09307.1 hypothetical protein CCUG60883_00068 [Mycobacteroides salmoniphilum]
MAYLLLLALLLFYSGIIAYRISRQQAELRYLKNKIDGNDILKIVLTAIAGALFLLLLSPKNEVIYHISLWGVAALTLLATAIAFRMGSNRKLVHQTAKFAAIYLVAIFPLTILSSQNPTPASPSDILSAMRAGQIPNEFPIVTEDAGAELKQRDCVNLDQELGKTRLNKVQCGDTSAFRVIQVVSIKEQCVDDADLTYSSVTKRYVACLDYDWSADRCLMVKQGRPVRKVDCATPDSERVEAIVISTDNTLNCSQGGFAHPVRRFTVCTEAQK